MKKDNQELDNKALKTKFFDLILGIIIVAIMLLINFVATACTIMELNNKILKLEYHLTERK